MVLRRLALFVLVLTPAAIRAQAPDSERRVREAQSKFALAIWEQNRDRILEAVRLLEEAVRLDPSAAAPRKALAPLYLLLGRSDSAVTALRDALTRDPSDAASWNLLAETLHNRGDRAGSATAWDHGVACPAVQLPLMLAMLRKLGHVREELRDFTGAEAAYRQAAKLLDEQRTRFLEMGTFSAAEWQAESATTLEAVGRACAAAGRPTEAIAAYRQAQARAATDSARLGRLNWRIAEVLASQGQSAEALQTLQPYLAQHPPNRAAFELLVRLLRQQGHGDQIISTLNTAARAQPEFLSLHLLLAQELATAGQADDSDALFRDLAKRAPTATVYRAWFVALQKQERMATILGLLDSALSKSADEQQTAARAERQAATDRARAMTQALRSEPKLIAGLVAEALREPPQRREKRATDTLRVLGTLAKQARQLDAAEALLRSALSRSGRQARQRIFDLLLDVLGMQRKYSEIVALCRGEMQHRWRWASTYLYFQLAMAYDHLGRWPEALGAIDRAIAGPQGQGDLTKLFLHLRRAMLLQHAGRYVDAIADCNALLKEYRKPDQVREVRSILAGIYAAMRDTARAEAQLRLVLESDPSDATANNDLGYYLADAGKDLDEAERLIRKAIDLDRAERRQQPAADDDSPAFLDSLGWVLFRRGQFAEAKQWLERASRLPDGEFDPSIWDHLGDAYARLGAPDRARAAWEKAVALYATERRQAGDDRPDEVKRKIAISNKQ